jgi:pimeloyl-ACP methyl ester carboxylesterase
VNERELEIPLHDGKVIRGKLIGEWGWPLIIFVHGLTAHKEEVLPYTASRWFVERGYSFLRFDLYSGHENGRKMSESSLFAHAADMNAITCFVKQYGVDRIYLAGHSLGAYTLAMADKHWIDGLMFWDPSWPLTPTVTRARYPYIEQLGSHLREGSITTLLSAQYLESVEQFRLTHYVDDWAETPTLIVCAGGGILAEAGDTYASTLAEYTEVYRAKDVEGADHNFTSDEWRETLFLRSLEWLHAH